MHKNHTDIHHARSPYKSKSRFHHNSPQPLENQSAKVNSFVLWDGCVEKYQVKKP
jgi:hypothetical protein